MNYVLPDFYEAYRQTNHAAVPAEKFFYRICNESTVLPVYGFDSPRFHFPVTGLGKYGWLAPEDDNIEVACPAPKRGWTHRRVLIVLNGPEDRDIATKVPLSLGGAGTDGSFMRAELRGAGLDPDDISVTYVCRFAKPESMQNYASKHKTLGAPFLHADIEQCKPDVVLTCGADALKAIMGRDAKLDTYRGGVYTCKIGEHTFKMIPSVTPAMFRTEYADITVFRAELLRIKELLDGTYAEVKPWEQYRVCDTVESVEQLCNDIRRIKPKRIAFDTEFGNDVAREEYSYVLSIQLSWGPGQAAFVKLRQQVPQEPYDEVVTYGKPKKDGTPRTRVRHIVPGPKCGVPLYTPEDEAKVWTMLQELFLDKTWQLCGHHLRVDIAQFAKAGYPIDSRLEDGFCTMLVHHLLSGDDSQGLDHLVRKYRPGYGAYWHHLDKWLTANGPEAQLRFGFRNIPLDILIPYGLDDAAVTWLVAEDLEAELEKFPALKSYYHTQVAPTALHLLDVERHGIRVDENRRTELRDAYTPVYEDLLQELRTLIEWPEFNPRSDDDVCSLLFSTAEFRGKKITSPEGARVLALDPLLTTDKYPKPWKEIVEAGKEKEYAPSTKATTLELLGQIHPDILELKLLRHLSVVGKFLTTYLAGVELNEFGVPEDGAGFHNNIGNDGRVRTRLSQLTQTGRYTSSKANLQTNPKKQEAALLEAVVFWKFRISLLEYKKRSFNGKINKATGAVEKPAYDGPDRIAPADQINFPAFKTVYVPDEGNVFIEVDFKNAELVIWAYLSGDKGLIEIVEAGRDLHSEVSCDSFKLPPLEGMQAAIDAVMKGDKAAYEAWNVEFKKHYEAQRTAGKTVNFGIIYGRQAMALLGEIKRQGVKNIELPDCENIIESVKKKFPVGWQWLVDNAEFAVNHEYLENCFGRRRYFSGVSQLPRKVQAAVRREAKNSNIQGAVAGLLERAGINLYTIRYRLNLNLAFRVLLPIHDAFLIECPKSEVAKTKEVIIRAMSTFNPIPGTKFKLGVDIEVMTRWGEKH